MDTTSEVMYMIDDESGLPREALAEELRALRRALRDSRERLYRGALESTRRICALTSELTRLEQLNAAYRKRLESMASDEPLIDMARRLVQSREENEMLRKELRRVGVVEKALRDAHAECSRMACERDGLALEVAVLQQNMSAS